MGFLLGTSGGPGAWRGGNCKVIERVVDGGLPTSHERVGGLRGATPVDDRH